MDLSDINLSNLGDKALEVLTKPITDKLNAQIDKLAVQARTKLAAEQKIQPAQVTDLAVAEYISGIPTAKLTQEVGTKMEYIGQTTRNGLIIGLGLIALAIMFSAVVKKSHNHSATE